MGLKTRAWTADEIRDKFLDRVQQYVDEWAHAEDRTTRGKLEGLAFSIFVLLDGEGDKIPAFTVASRPHPADKTYCRTHNENWYPNGVDIAGDLHDTWARNR